MDNTNEKLIIDLWDTSKFLLLGDTFAVSMNEFGSMQPGEYLVKGTIQRSRPIEVELYCTKTSEGALIFSGAWQLAPKEIHAKIP